MVQAKALLVASGLDTSKMTSYEIFGLASQIDYKMYRQAWWGGLETASIAAKMLGG